MSAIVAAAGRRLSDRTRRWLVEATAYSADAGPDLQAVAAGARWGLGHALLRTGADEPEQPLERGGVWLAADVRLDRRAELESSLHSHRQAVDETSSDPELLLAAYLAWGDSFVERLAGDFAFALWDETRRALVCGRDQIGVAPLHYAYAGEEILVASALDALLLHPAVSDELDEDALADFLVFGRGDFAATTFRAIRRLPPAHTATWAGGDLRLRRYWRQPEWQPLVRFGTQEEYVTRFRTLLEIAVAERITADRLGVQVSGGMDSTSVAGIARLIMTERGLPNDSLRGVTMVLGGNTGDEEGRYAELVARELDLELDTLVESSFEPTDPLAEPTPRTPEPTPYTWTAMQYESVRRSAAVARVLLTGLPGDSLLMFVPWYWAEWLGRGHPVRLALALADNARLFRTRPHLGLRASARHVRAALRSPAPAPPGWLAPDFAERTAAAERPRALELTRGDAIDVRSIGSEPFWTTLFLWGDPTFTRLPLRLRHPLADLRLLDFAARVPPEPWLMRKRILREAVKDLLPAPVLARPKTPLVRGRRPSITPAATARLAHLVRTLPEGERFFDVRALSDEVTALDAAANHAGNHQFVRAIGLVHWCAHWQRLEATGLRLTDVRVRPDILEEKG